MTRVDWLVNDGQTEGNERNEGNEGNDVKMVESRLAGIIIMHGRRSAC
jgi:hypothetical protein